MGTVRTPESHCEDQGRALEEVVSIVVGGHPPGTRITLLSRRWWQTSDRPLSHPTTPALGSEPKFAPPGAPPMPGIRMELTHLL